MTPHLHAARLIERVGCIAGHTVQRALTWRQLTMFATLLVLIGTTSACGDGDDDVAGDVAVVEVVAREPSAAGAARSGTYVFGVPERVRAGATRFMLTNEGREEHHAQLFKLNDGATVHNLTNALAEGGPPAALAHGTYEGGTGLVAPGSRSRADAVVDLTEGTYVVLCFVPGGDGLPHLSHGMVKPFVVVASNDAAEAPEPDVDVDLVDYAFDAPDTLARDALLSLTNRGAVEPHEMTIARLDDGASVEDVRAALAAGTPPPATMVGGMQALLPGATQLLQLDLEPGEYVLSCSVPSPPDETPHHVKGMLAGVTVT